MAMYVLLQTCNNNLQRFANGKKFIEIQFSTLFQFKGFFKTFFIVLMFNVQTFRERDVFKSKTSLTER